MDEVKLNLGKNGVTQEFLDEVKSQIHNRKRVKIKVLKSALGDEKTKDIAEKIKNSIKCKILDVRGHIITVEKF